jgi:aspartate/tyrosine/aromatic aminotransferase
VLKTIDGTGAFLSNVYGNVSPRLKFWDEVTDFPAIHLNAGSETREYQGGGYKDRYLNITVRVYVNQEDAVDALDKLIEDIETVLEDNSRLTYTDKQGVSQFTHQISIISINTDEGVLEPYGVAEISIQVRY